MLAADYLRIKDEFNGNGIIFSFSGFISEGILYALGEALRVKLTLGETDSNVVKRVFSVFVELTQNIIRYSAEKTGEPQGTGYGSGIITVGIDGGRFFVACGNIIHAPDVEPLRAKLERLRAMSPAEIKTHYLAQIKEPPQPGSMGANVGLIEIARRASEPIQFDFIGLDDDTSFYCMKAFI